MLKEVKPMEETKSNYFTNKIKTLPYFYVARKFNQISGSFKEICKIWKCFPHMLSFFSFCLCFLCSHFSLKHMRFQNTFSLNSLKENERENDWENCEKLFTFPKSFVAKSVDGGQVRGVQVCTSLIINYGINIFSENCMEKLYYKKTVLMAWGKTSSKSDCECSSRKKTNRNKSQKSNKSWRYEKVLFSRKVCQIFLHIWEQEKNEKKYWKKEKSFLWMYLCVVFSFGSWIFFGHFGWYKIKINNTNRDKKWC